MRYVVMFRGINVGGKHIVKMDELKKLLEQLGFSHVYFFQNAYSKEDLGEKINSYDGKDLMKGEEKEIYLLCHQSIRNSKLVTRASKVLEAATVRNLKSANKLYEMMCSM